MALEITTTEFEHEGTIPARLTCDGDNVSPALTWTDPPEGTQSFVLIVDDPDAPVGTFVHWVAYNIPGDARGLPEGVAADEELPDGTRQGYTDFASTGYGGPCPPGGTHRYYFKLYALDTMLELAPGATKHLTLFHMIGHQIGDAVLVGRYTRG